MGSGHKHLLSPGYIGWQIYLESGGVCYLLFSVLGTYAEAGKIEFSFHIILKTVAAIK